MPSQLSWETYCLVFIQLQAIHSSRGFVLFNCSLNQLSSSPFWLLAFYHALLSLVLNFISETLLLYLEKPMTFPPCLSCLPMKLSFCLLGFKSSMFYLDW